MSYTNGLDKPSDYFETVTYTGNSSTQSITSLDFKPDWVWLKNRSNADGHGLFDSVRGVNKRLISNTNEAEVTASGVTAFNSNGFSLGSAKHNDSGQTFVGWCWKASGSTASNTNGTNITSTVDANTTAGFSIVSYTGTNTATDTVGHGLSSLDLLIVKTRNETDSWFVKTKDLASSKNLNLDQTVAETNVGSAYSEGGLSNLSGNTFGFIAGTDGNAYGVNEANNTHIAYCFKEVQGFSKFGKFIGNGSATDGTFIFTGFKPAWIMIKCINAAGELWHIHDVKRTPTNTNSNSDGRIVYANDNAAETDSVHYRIQMYSNGFKAMNSNDSTNVDGNSYFFMAFAEQPFVTSTGVPATAR